MKTFFGFPLRRNGKKTNWKGLQNTQNTGIWNRRIGEKNGRGRSRREAAQPKDEPVTLAFEKKKGERIKSGPTEL